MKHDGLLLVDKKSGMTSHDVVDRFRRVSRIKKAGHTGTLDPLATGLLILCVERTTRLQNYLTGLEKTYEGTIQFGWATDTYDADGTAVAEANEADVSAVDFEPLLAPLRGAIEQMPPAYSAKKIDGRRAYEIARSGEIPALKVRPVNVYEFVITGLRGSKADFRVRCSAGTYIRSLAHDLGQSLGVGAHLLNLRRTAIGEFRVEDSIGFDKMSESTVEQLLAPPHFIAMSDINLPLQRVSIDLTQEKQIANGQSVIVKPDGVELAVEDLVSVLSLRDELLAIGVVARVLREGGGPVEIQPKVVLRG